MAYLKRHRRLGMSLLELVLATSLTAIAIVPALQLIREGMKISAELETRQLTTTYCVSKLEEALCVAAASWNSTTLTGTFATDGYSSLRYSVVSSDATVNGGMPDQLMSVSVVVWDDTNNDGAVSSGELKTSMRSKIAKLTTYQNAATP